jgi:thiol-disulfide isomerase/thioredoxin
MKYKIKNKTKRLNKSNRRNKINKRLKPKRKTYRKRNVFFGGNHKTYIVKYWAKWCGHCMTLAPIWDVIEKQNKNGNLEFINIESENMESGSKIIQQITSEKIDVTGFPTIIKIINQKVEHYTGMRDHDSLLKWIGM